MKKLISLLLSVLMIFTLAAMSVSAAEETTAPAEEKIKVIFQDDNGSVLDEIEVSYGEDFTKKAPTVKGYVAEGFKYSHSGWQIEDYVGVIAANKVPTNWVKSLPVFDEDDGDYVEEVTFKALYAVKPYDGEAVLEDIIGEGTVNYFQVLYERFVAFVNELILFLRNLVFA